MPLVRFKAKVETIYNMDDSVAYQRIKVPELRTIHCDMHGFRTHPKYGSYANSTLFPSLLKRALAAAGIGAFIRLDQVPAAAKVDLSGFLAAVSIEL